MICKFLKYFDLMVRLWAVDYGCGFENGSQGIFEIGPSLLSLGLVIAPQDGKWYQLAYYQAKARFGTK
jgi:hypothetical protein